MAPAKAEAAPVGAPVTATHGDIQRQKTTARVGQRGMWRHGPDTTRHGGLGLQNRRLQVRFLSHLPASPEFKELAGLWPQLKVWALPSI